jgi:site-specific DNA-methyltransferase (adenine-specific)
MSIQLLQGDCIEVMKTLPAGSVDAIITDLPYGTTACKWDEVIPFAPMWEQVKRVLKPRGVFVTTASQPFTSALVMSNLEWFRQELVWDKVLPVGFLDANRRHMRRHENILLFSSVGETTYNPQKWKSEPYQKGLNSQASVYGAFGRHAGKSEDGMRFPTSIIQESNADRQGQSDHPTQKPVALYEYLILTYTNPGDTVLDITAGSGTTGVACVKTGRNAILIEKDPVYFETTQRRIKQVQAQPLLFEATA